MCHHVWFRTKQTNTELASKVLVGEVLTKSDKYIAQVKIERPRAKNPDRFIWQVIPRRHPIESFDCEEDMRQHGHTSALTKKSQICVIDFEMVVIVLSAEKPLQMDLIKTIEEHAEVQVFQ